MQAHCSPQLRGHQAIEQVAETLAAMLDNIKHGSLAADADLTELRVWARVSGFSTDAMTQLRESGC